MINALDMSFLIYKKDKSVITPIEIESFLKDFISFVETKKMLSAGGLNGIEMLDKICCLTKTMTLILKEGQPLIIHCPAHENGHKVTLVAERIK